MNGTVVIVAVVVLVLALAALVVSALKRRDLGMAIGDLSRETVKRDRAAVTPARAEAAAPVTGKEIERAAVLARTGKDVVAATPKTPAPFVAPDADAVGVSRRQFLNRSIIGGMVLATSTGFRGAYLRSSQGISMTAIAGEGTGMERDYDFTSALHGADLASPASIGARAAERAIKRINPRKVETCKAPVVFEPRVAGTLLGHLAGAINGASIARKSSFLKDRLGQQLFDASVQIVDDPLMRRGLRSQPFDAEGVAVSKQAFIENGVLTSWILDCATARELGLATNAHAHRGVSSAPSPGAYNLYLAAGRVSPKELIADIRQGFYITDLIGSGVNGVTGDYSRGASGYWIENGEIAYPVAEVTIAGHLNDIFHSLIPANDLEFRYGVNSPTVRIEGLTIAGR